MSTTHAFGATNEPDTCLWCGVKLRTNYTMGERQEYVTWRDANPSAYWEKEGEKIKVVKVRYINKEATGKGHWNDGFFCTITCAMQFGKAMARNGRRLQPKG